MQLDKLQRVKKNFKRFFVIIGILLVGFLIGSYWLLQTGFAREKLKQAAIAVAREKFNVDLQIGELSGGILYDLSLGKVKLVADGNVIFEADRISCEYFGHMLLANTLLVEVLRVEGLKLNLIRNIDGTWNIKNLFRPNKESSEKSRKKIGTRLVLKRIAVDKSSISTTLKNSENDRQIKFNDINFVARLRKKKIFTADIRHFSWFPGSNSHSRISLDGRISHDPDTKQVRLDKINLKSEESKATINGLFTLHPENPTVDIVAGINALSLEELKKTLSLRNLPEGIVAGSLQIKGSPECLSHTLDLRLRELGIHTEGSLNLHAPKSIDLEVTGSITRLNPALFYPENTPSLSGKINADFTSRVNNLLASERSVLAEINISSSRISELEMTDGSIDLEIDRDQVLINNFHFETGIGEADGHGGLTGIFAKNGEKHLALSSRFRCINPFEIVPGQDLPGNLNMEIDLEGAIPNSRKLADATAEITAKIHRSSLSDFEIQDGQFSGNWHENSLSIDHLNLTFEEGTVAVKGAVIPEQNRPNLKAEIDIPDIGKLAKELANHFPEMATRFPDSLSTEGRLSLSGGINGTWKEPDISFTANVKNFSGKDITSESIKMMGKWRRSSADFASSSSLDVEEISIGNTRLHGLKAQVDLNQKDLSLNLDCTHDSGTKIELEGEIFSWVQPSKLLIINDLRMIANGTVLTNQPPIHLQVSQENLDVSSCDLYFDNTPISISGGLTKAGDKTLTVHVEELDFGTLSRTFSGNFWPKGKCSMTSEIKGWLDRPVVTTSLQGSALAFKNVSADSLVLKSTFECTRNIKECLGDVKFEASKLKINEESFPQVRLDSQIAREGTNIKVAATHENGGTLSLDGLVDIWYRPSKIVMNDIKVTLDDLPISNHDPIELSISDDTLEVSPFQLTSGQTTLYGDIKLTRNNIQSLNLTVNTLNLGRLNKLWDENLKTSGLLSGEVSISGSPQSPIVNAHFTCDSGRVNDFSFSSMTTQTRLADSVATTDIRVDREGAEPITIAGTAGMNLSMHPFNFNLEPGSLDLALKADGVNIAELPIPKKPNLKIDGALELDVRIRTALKTSRPQFAGKISLRNGSLTLRKQGLSYETINCEFRLMPNKIILDQLSVQGDEEGTIKCTGEVSLTNLKPSAMNIQLTGTDVLVPYQKAYTARVQPNLLLSGTLAEPSLSGTIEVEEGRVKVDRISKQTSPEIEIVRTQPGNNGESSENESDQKVAMLIKPLAADIYINIPKNAWLKGKDMHIEMAGKIHLKKSADKPFNLLGTLNSVRGTYDFRGKLFKVTKGEVTFIGLDEPNPNLDIEAATRIKKVDIIIRIGGSPKNITLMLDSEPRMAQADIISYLVFGQPTDSLKGERAFSAERAALNLTGQMAANELKSLMGDVFVIDTFSVDTSGDDIRTGAVNLGKYVSPKIFLTYHQGFTSEEPREIRVNYEIDQHFSVEAQVGDEKSNGVDLIWEQNF